MSCPETIDSLSGEPAYRRIERLLRAAISSGEFACGSRLPTLRMLGEQYKTSIFTIQAAMESLAIEGLVERVPRLGTIVTSRSARLCNVGIYSGRDFVRGHAMGFCQELNRQLCSELDSRQVNYRSWIDGRPDGKHDEPLRELARAVSRREMRGIIVSATCIQETSWLQQLGLPLAVLSSAPAPCRVGIDNDRMMELAMQEFKRQGCRKIGAILPVSPLTHGLLEPHEPNAIEQMFHSFADRLADARLETRNSWIRVSDRFLFPGEHEEYGYRQFREIWNQPDRPDGLLVWPDTVVRGVITAMLEAQVSVPGDLKLVLHRNSGVPLLCPLAASWVVSDVARIASALIRQLERQVAGETVTPLLVSPRIETAAG